MNARQALPAWRSLEAKATRWLCSVRPRLDPDLTPLSRQIFVTKGLAEVSLLLALRKRLDPDSFDADNSSLVDHLSRVSRRESQRELIGLDPYSFPLHVLIYAGLRICGHDDGDLRWKIEKTVDSGYVLCVQRVPYRYLDLMYSLQLAGIGHKVRGIKAIGVLSLQPGFYNAIQLTERDMYSLTHTIFYLTDFGMRTSRLKDEETRAIIEQLETLLIIARGRANVDLAAELLAALTCLGVFSSSEIDQTWPLIFNFQAPDRRIPASGQVESDPTEEWPSGLLADCHTTVVAAIAALLARTLPLSSPPVPPSDASPPRLTIQRLPEIRGALKRSALWLCSNAERSSLSSALVTIAAALEAENVLRSKLPPMRDALSALAGRLDATAPEPQDLVESEAAPLQTVARAMDRYAISRLSDEWIQHALSSVGAQPSGHTQPLAASSQRIAAELASPLKGPRDFNRCLKLIGRDSLTVDSTETEDAPSHEVRDKLIVLLAMSCRENRLTHVAILTRYLIRLGFHDHRATRDGVRFLLGRQRPDGRFGPCLEQDTADPTEGPEGLCTVACSLVLTDYCQSLRRRVDEHPTSERSQL